MKLRFEHHRQIHVKELIAEEAVFYCNGKRTTNLVVRSALSPSTSYVWAGANLRARNSPCPIHSARASPGPTRQ